MDNSTFKTQEHKKGNLQTQNEASRQPSKLIDNMNMLLADLHLHYMTLRNFHWNVTGPHFFSLHEAFENQYNVVKADIDDLAERIVLLGYRPVARYRDMLALSHLSEPDLPMEPHDMVAYLVKNLRTIQENLHETIPMAGESGEPVTEDLMINIKSHLDVDAWMLNSYLK